jgi:hypothetical protein
VVAFLCLAIYILQRLEKLFSGSIFLDTVRGALTWLFVVRPDDVPRK